MSAIAKAGIVIAVVTLLAGCTDNPGAMRALKGAGYHDIKITGYRFLGCDSGKGSDDNWHTGFDAVGPTGERVTGVVCAGFLKGNTIRTD